MPILVLAGGCYLYTSLFSLPGTPIFRAGDESFFWTYACRILSGQIFLRDFHQFTPPGTDLVYAGVFHVFGVSVVSCNWLILWLGLALTIICYFCARAVLQPRFAALAALLSLVVLYGDRMDATHHWFSSLANLISVLVLLPRRTWLRVVMAGMLFGFASFFTQTRGAAGLLACCIWLCWERGRKQTSVRTLGLQLALLAGATFAVWLGLSWHFIADAGIANYWNAQVVYLPRDANFPTGFLIPQFSWPAHLSGWIGLLKRVSTYLLLIAVCPSVVFVGFRRRFITNMGTAPMLLSLLGVFQTLEVVTALNWNRMAAVALPSMILAVWLVSQMEPLRRAVVPACWYFAGCLIVAESLPMQLHHFVRIHLPTGPALFQRGDDEEVSWLVRHTRPGDTFFEAANLRLYAPLRLRNPTPVDLVTTTNSTLHVWVTEVVEGLDRSQTRYVLWSRRMGIGSLEQMHQIPSDHLDPLRIYLTRAYTRVCRFEDGDEIWERKVP